MKNDFLDLKPGDPMCFSCFYDGTCVTFEEACVALVRGLIENGAIEAAAMNNGDTALTVWCLIRDPAKYNEASKRERAAP